MIEGALEFGGVGDVLVEVAASDLADHGDGEGDTDVGELGLDGGEEGVV